MSTSRSGFLKGLNKLGFGEKSVNTQMNRYFPREFFEKGDHVVAMSTKNNEVEVTLYHTKAKTILRFDNYKDALKSIMNEEERIQNRLSTLLDGVEIDSERILSFIELISSYPCYMPQSTVIENERLKVSWSNPEKKAQLTVLIDQSGDFHQELKVRKVITNNSNNHEELLLTLNRYFS